MSEWVERHTGLIGIVLMLVVFVVFVVFVAHVNDIAWEAYEKETEAENENP